ncbi:hypothetical protein DM860_010338 [Cuscuta australis]|uniref:Uncharacterized protein n=1 Tax=Cuscuta australis TaxID=267555 RepID=A0A328D7Y4_9ASTE|nr:hypothetical protein DM860_010338 [Cuscuta australis]
MKRKMTSRIGGMPPVEWTLSKSRIVSSVEIRSIYILGFYAHIRTTICVLSYRSALEEVKFLQKQREKKLGIPAVQTAAQPAPGCGPGATSNGIAGGLVAKPVNEKGEGDGEKDDLVLQDTFAEETAVMVEDPNM